MSARDASGEGMTFEERLLVGAVRWSFGTRRGEQMAELADFMAWLYGYAPFAQGVNAPGGRA